MDFKVPYTRGDQIYVVEYEGYYYLMNLTADYTPIKYEYVEAILKFGDFEDITEPLPAEDLAEIERRLKKYKDIDFH